MAEIIIPRTHLQQPQGRAVLDLSSPFADRLAFLVLHSEGGVRELVSDSFASSGLKAQTAGELGDGGKFTVGAEWPALRLVTTTGDYAGDFSYLSVSAPSASGGRGVLAASCSVGNQSYLFANVDAGYGPSPGMLAFGCYTGASRFVTAAGVIDGQPHVFAAVRRGSQGTLDVDGVQVGLNGDMSGACGSGSNVLSIESLNGYSGYTNAASLHYLTAALNRALTPDERVELGANPWQLLRFELVRIYSLPADGASAGGQPLTVSSSLVPGAASGGAAAAGQTISAAVSFIPGAATGAGAGSAPGALLTTTQALTPGVTTGQASAPGDTIATAVALTVGAASGAATAAGQTVSQASVLLAGGATGAGTAAGTSLAAALNLIPGAVTAGGVANAPGATVTIAASIAPGAATGAAAAVGAVFASASSLIPGAASAGAAGSASGAIVTAAVSLLPGVATGAAAASGQALSLSASLLPGAATAGGVGAAPGAIISTSASVIAGAVSGGASVPARTWQAFLSLIPGAASGESAGSQPGVAPGAEFAAFLALIVGDASGVVVDDYPMKYATLADMVTRFGQTELAQLTDTVNMPPSSIDTTRVQIAINDAQMEIDSAVGRIYRLPLSGCIRPPVLPGTEPTAVAPPQLTRLACDIARFFLYDDLAPENEVVRRYKQAKATLEDIANGDLQLACPWGGSPGELIGTDAQSGSAEVYDCFSPRQITDDTLRGF